jgi:hypothetical protein
VVSQAEKLVLKMRHAIGHPGHGRESGLGLARGLARHGRDTGEVISRMLTGWEEYEREGVRYVF